jgi:hypothetical protein
MPAHPIFALEHDTWWTATVILPSWRGFQRRGGAYGARDSTTPSDGSVQMVFAPEGRGNEPLASAELASIIWVIENEAAIARALLASVVQAYPALQARYGYTGREKTALMPDLVSTDDLRSLIGLYAVNVHQTQKNGLPYAGFEFGCTWDAEHGLGVLMHGTRTVEIGGADTAILLRLAEGDAAKP